MGAQKCVYCGLRKALKYGRVAGACKSCNRCMLGQILAAAGRPMPKYT